MILRLPDHVFVWSDSGRKDHASEVGFTLSGDSLRVEVSAPLRPIAEIVLRWNESVSTSTRILGDHWERGYGDLEWRGVIPERVMPWYALLQSSQGTIGLGVQTGAASIASWQNDPQGFSLRLDLRCGTQGVQLGQRTLLAATVRILHSGPGETPFTFAQRFCRSLCPAPCLPKFPIYGGNDWYYAYGNNSDASIRRDAALIREHSPNLDNPPFMVIDAGWFPTRGCSGGPYREGNEKFPDMPKLAADMKSMQVRPGIWIRPLLTSECPESWRLPSTHPIHHKDRGMFLDPSIPEVIELVKADIARLKEWGYELIKHDFTTFDITGRWGFEMGDGRLSSGNWSFADPTRTTAEIVRDLYQAIRDAAEDAVLIGCNTIGHLGAGLFELQRTGDDTSGKEWERTRKMGINTLAFRMPQHRAFFDVDADCVGLTEDVPWELNEQWLELLAGSGTPLFVSADPRAVGQEQSAALKRAFALAATELPIAEPLDWIDTTCPTRWQLNGQERVFDWTPRADQIPGADIPSQRD